MFTYIQADLYESEIPIKMCPSSLYKNQSSLNMEFYIVNNDH